MSTEWVTELVIGLWPYSDDGRYDKRIELLEEVIGATIKAGVQREQIEAAMKRSALECGTIMPWFRAVSKRLDDLRYSEKRRKESSLQIHGGHEIPGEIDASEHLPWRKLGMSLRELVQKDKKEAMRMAREHFRGPELDAMISLIDRGAVHDSDLSNAIECGLEMCRYSGKSMQGGNIF